MQCTGCLMSIDCGSCVCCKDMKKFGGPGKKKKGCLKKKCVGTIPHDNVRSIIIITVRIITVFMHSLNIETVDYSILWYHC